MILLITPIFCTTGDQICMSDIKFIPSNSVILIEVSVKFQTFVCISDFVGWLAMIAVDKTSGQI